MRAPRSPAIYRWGSSHVYRQIASIGGRVLYRFLNDARSTAMPGPDGKVTQVSFDLKLLARNLGLLEARPSHLRQQLEPMGQNLIDAGFLCEVTYLGRGSASRVQFRFAGPDARHARHADEPQAQDAEVLLAWQSELIAALTAQGVHPWPARQFVYERSEPEIRAALSRFQDRLANPQQRPVKDRGAYLSELIRREAGTGTAPTGPVPGPPPPGAAAPRPLPVPAVTLEPEDDLTDLKRRLEGRTQIEITELLLTPFRIQQLSRRGLSIIDIDRLRSAILDHELDPVVAERRLREALYFRHGQTAGLLEWLLCRPIDPQN